MCQTQHSRDVACRGNQEKGSTLIIQHLIMVLMEKKKTFHPGDGVTTFTGQAGVVISSEVLARVREHFREGKKPGRFFAPGCCHNPDYIIQIPVFFEDGTFDVMRAMNIRRAGELPEGTLDKINAFLETL